MKSISVDIAAYLKEKSQLIDKHLDSLLNTSGVSNPSLLQAARYSLMSGGKRLRPSMTLATTESFAKESVEIAIPIACAIEMIHTYSLIHDDLPCMDNDDYRRGKPTLHKVVSEGQAVLAGDFLLTYAFEVLANSPGLTAEQRVSLTRLIAKAAGGEGMIGGQVMDIEAEGIPLDQQALSQIHKYKTGAMMTASLEAGAIVAQANQSEIAYLRSFGDDLGLAFQIIDDVIDVTAPFKKKRQSDQDNNKVTYVSLMGLEAAKKEAFMLLDRALSHLTKLSCDVSLLRELAFCLVQRET
jgi:geranylgeranyl pyrophosphate synthase